MTHAAARLRAVVPYAALLLVAGYLYGETDAFVRLGREGQLSPAFWPRAVLILLAFVSAVEIVRGTFFFTPEKASAVPHSAAPLPSEEGDGQRFPLLLAGGIGLTLLYVPAMQYLGFFLATVAYLAAFMWMGRYRRPVVIAVTSLAGTLAFVVVFMKIVYVSLPLGAGPFRAFSAWILAALGIH